MNSVLNGDARTQMSSLSGRHHHTEHTCLEH